MDHKGVISVDQSLMYCTLGREGGEIEEGRQRCLILSGSRILQALQARVFFYHRKNTGRLQEGAGMIFQFYCIEENFTFSKEGTIWQTK